MSVADRLFNIFEQKNTRLSELEAVVAASPFATFITNSEGECTYANYAYQALVGCDAADLVGHGWKQIVHPDDASVVTALWADGVAHEQEIDLHYQIVRPDGEVLPVHCRAYKMPSGNYVGYVNATNGSNCRFICRARETQKNLERVLATAA